MEEIYWIIKKKIYNLRRMNSILPSSFWVIYWAFILGVVVFLRINCPYADSELYIYGFLVGIIYLVLDAALIDLRYSLNVRLRIY